MRPFISASLRAAERLILPLRFAALLPNRQRVRCSRRLERAVSMKHRLSATDREFRKEFEACKFPPAEFSHRAHVRLAYVYLTEHDTDAAHQLMQNALLNFLRYHGIDVSKYHQTMTRAWIMAVRHFMEISLDSESHFT